MERPLSALLVGLAACGPASSSIDGPLRPPVATASASAAVAELEPGRIEAPGQVACLVRTESTASGTLDLFLAEDRARGPRARPALRMRYEAATFALSGGQEEGVSVVSAQGHGVSIDALVGTPQVPLFVRSSRRLASGIITPSSQTRVTLVRVESRSLRVRLVRHDLLQLTENPIEETMPCDDLAATGAASPMSSAGKPIALSAAGGLELRSSPTSEPALRVFAPRAVDEILLEAMELGRSDGYVRVEIPSPYGFFTGWANTASVRPRAAYGAHGGVLGRLDGSGRSPAPETQARMPSSSLVCPQGVRFAAVTHQAPSSFALTWLGEIRPGTPIARPSASDAVKPAPDGWTSVRLRGLQEVEATVVVRERDLDACSEPSAAEP